VQDEHERHFALISRRLAEGRIVPFLGAGASLCDRVTGEAWRPGCGFLPSGAELAEHLAQSGEYPVRDRRDLMQVAQWIEWTRGEEELYHLLHEVFDQDYPPTSLHRWLARAARSLAREGRPQLLVATMNYDDLVERAFAEEGLNCDVVWYEAAGEFRGQFVHQPPGGEPQLIGSRLPIALRVRLSESSLLFLGYSLSTDWDMRAFMAEGFALRVKSWSVLRLASDPDRRQVEKQLWDSLRDVELVPFELRDYVEALSARDSDMAPP